MNDISKQPENAILDSLLDAHWNVALNQNGQGLPVSHWKSVRDVEKMRILRRLEYRSGFNRLREANISRNAEWNTTGETLRPSFRGNEAGGETGEAIEAALANLLQLAVVTGRMQNVLKKIERGQLGIKGSTATVEDLADELGDMQICLDLVAMDFKIDLFEATSRKFNRTSDKLGFVTKL